MLDLLKAGPKTTGELCERFADLDRCTVMQHVGVLEQAELVIVRRRGRHRWVPTEPCLGGAARYFPLAGARRITM
jgi:DNA-binding transcriptional ArsR family regulator